jgi:hypothetical protein
MANRYKNTKQLKTAEGRRYLLNSVYPDIPFSEDDYYVISTGGDRYDTLAQQFYGDSSLWWVIAAANTSKRDSIIPKPGAQLRIPADGPSVVALFEDLNRKR